MRWLKTTSGEYIDLGCVNRIKRDQSTREFQVKIDDVWIGISGAVTMQQVQDLVDLARAEQALMMFNQNKDEIVAAMVDKLGDTIADKVADRVIDVMCLDKSKVTSPLPGPLSVTPQKK